MLYNLSPEQQSCIENIRNNSDCSTVKYIDRKVAIDTLFYNLIDEILTGKSVQIICEEQGLKNELLTKLAELGLSDFMLETTVSSIPDRKIANLRSNFKSKFQNIDSREEELKLSFIQKQVAEKYAKLNFNIVSDIKVVDLPLVLSRKNNSNIAHTATNRVTVNLADHHKTLRLVDDISVTYKPIYEELNASEIINEETRLTLKNESNILALRGKILDLIQLNDDLAKDYQDIRDGYFDKSEASYITKYTDIVNYLQQALIKSSISTSENIANDRFLLFKKKSTDSQNTVEDQINEISERLKQLDPTLSTDLNQGLTTKQELERYLQTLLDRVQAEKAAMSFSEQEITKHLSLLNQEDDRWTEAAKSLDRLVTRLNNLNLFDSSIENNSKGLEQQIQLLSKINSTLQRISYRLKTHVDYYTFQAEILESDIKKGIVERFKHTPQEKWHDSYDYMTFLDIKKKYQKTNLPTSTDNLNELLEQYQTAMTEILGRVKMKLAVNQKNVLDTIKSNKSLFQNLLKKKLPLQMSATEMITQYFDSSKAMFPIHLNRQSGNGYDSTYILGDIEHSIADATAIFVPFNEEDFKDLSQEKDYIPLYLNHYQYTTKIDELSNTNKIKAAKKLAKLILSTNQEIKIYQLKSANIVSLLPFQDDQILEEMLEEHGCKSMDLDDVYNRLVESLLATERRQYIVVKDGLLKSSNIDTISFQLQTLSHLEVAGVQILSIYTNDQLRSDMVQPIKLMCHTIVDMTDSTNEKVEGLEVSLINES